MLQDIITKINELKSYIELNFPVDLESIKLDFVNKIDDYNLLIANSSYDPLTVDTVLVDDILFVFNSINEATTDSFNFLRSRQPNIIPFLPEYLDKTFEIENEIRRINKEEYNKKLPIYIHKNDATHLRGKAISNIEPNSGHILRYTGGQWMPVPLNTPANINIYREPYFSLPTYIASGDFTFISRNLDPIENGEFFNYYASFLVDKNNSLTASVKLKITLPNGSITEKEIVLEGIVKQVYTIFMTEDSTQNGAVLIEYSKTGSAFFFEELPSVLEVIKL